MTSPRNLGTGATLAVYAAILAATFTAAAGLAAAVGPIDTSNDSHNEDTSNDHNGHEDATDHETVGARPHVPGISIDSDGFRILPVKTSIAADVATTYSFRIVDSDGDTVNDFDVTHERRLHLIVVSRNFDEYHHLHPTQDVGGVWTADVPALPGGSYRVFADTQPTGAQGITLGTDLAVGDAVVHTDASTAPPGEKVAVTIDGYQVEMTGTPEVGESKLTFTVARDGEPVLPDPYLGASGHLVALRAGDLAFLHVHPLGDATHEAPGIRFAAEFPTAGTYRLFLDVSIDGTVRTAPFTVEVPETSDGPDRNNENNDNDDPHETGH